MNYLLLYRKKKAPKFETNKYNSLKKMISEIDMRDYYPVFTFTSEDLAKECMATKEQIFYYADRIKTKFNLATGQLIRFYGTGDIVQYKLALKDNMVMSEIFLNSETAICTDALPLQLSEWKMKQMNYIFMARNKIRRQFQNQEIRRIAHLSDARFLKLEI